MYKTPKNLDEMITHLRVTKKIIIDTEKIDETKDILLRYNYINVISPYKHYYFKKDRDNAIKDSMGKHIYPEAIPFEEYYSKYKEERSLYPIIFKRISEFETIFNAVVSYHVINHYKFCSFEDFDRFCNELKLNLIKVKDKSKHYMIDEIDGFYGNEYGIKKYNNIYVFFDRLSIRKILTVFILTQDLTDLIFSDLRRFDATLNFTIVNQFINAVEMLVHIRNTVYHNNSLEILKRYYNVKGNQLRKSSNVKQYASLIKYLVRERKNGE